MADLRTVLAGAGVIALVGAAWWAGYVSASDVHRVELVAALDRVEALERRAEKRAEPAAESGERSRSRMAALEERVRAIELAPRTAASTGASVDSGRAPGARSVETSAAPTEDVEEQQLRATKISSLQTEAAALGRSMAGLRFRLLPEAERWKQAAEKLGLSGVQVDLLKQAVSNRNAAYADATTQDIEHGKEGMVSETKVDGIAVERADAEFRRSFEGALDSEQRKKWAELGFDGAFGTSKPVNRTLKSGVPRRTTD